MMLSTANALLNALSLDHASSSSFVTIWKCWNGAQEARLESSNACTARGWLAAIKGHTKRRSQRISR